MKYLIILTILITLFSYNALAQQDTLKPKLVTVEDVSKHLGELVTIYAQASGFDLRGQNKYIYLGSDYPNQKLTVIIKKTEESVPITLKWSVMAKKSKEYFTGTVITYNEKPDTSVRPDAERIKKEWDGKTIYFYSEGKRITGNIGNAIIPSFPVNLRGKPVMLVTKQNQIGQN